MPAWNAFEDARSIIRDACDIGCLVTFGDELKGQRFGVLEKVQLLSAGEVGSRDQTIDKSAVARRRSRRMTRAFLKLKHTKNPDKSP
jgi:hypothetical protein